MWQTGTRDDAASCCLQGPDSAVCSSTIACAHARPNGSTQTEAGGLSMPFLHKCYQHEVLWQQTEAALVADMRACAFCGRVSFGGQHSLHRSNFRKVAVPQDTIPTALQANPVALLQLCSAGNNSYYCCHTCHNCKSRALKSRYQQAASAAELKALDQIYSLDAGKFPCQSVYEPYHAVSSCLSVNMYTLCDP